jgi:penicillin-binding protein 2
MDYRDRWEHKEYLTERRLVRRVHLLHAVLVSLMLSFLLDAWYLQVVRGAEYARLAENNRLRRIPVMPSRGVILDREGEVLASTRPSLSLVLRREDPGDVDGQLRRLAPILGTSYEELRARFDQMRPRPLFEPLVLEDDVGLTELARIDARREWFPAVEVVEQARRSYPSGDAVAHAVGYIGEVSEAELGRRGGGEDLQRRDLVGKSGVERNYDLRLRGSRGWKFVSVNTLGRQVPGAAPEGRTPEDGEPLRLTLDLRLQRVLAEALRGEAGGGIFLDPWTGEVLAMASAPAYDPNLFAGGVSRDDWQALTADPQTPLHDRIVNSFYAPGSAFKIVMATAGLEAGKISPSHAIHCAGSIPLYGKRFLCWRKGGHGQVDLRRALTHSCNVYFYRLGQALDVDVIHHYGDLFNLGRVTRIDVPGERAGILPSRAWKQRSLRQPWYAGDTISLSIGQGLLAVTPVQMATMISAVATRGKLPRPHLVRGAAGQAPAELSISPQTFDQVQAALEDAVQYGTGRAAALAGVRVAGKTGTAQLYKASAGIDADKLPKAQRDHAWFVGYAPADRPRIAFAVVIEHGGHGGTTAAPVARKVLEAFFHDASGRPRPLPALRASGGRFTEYARAQDQTSR